MKEVPFRKEQTSSCNISASVLSWQRVMEEYRHGKNSRTISFSVLTIAVYFLVHWMSTLLVVVADDNSQQLKSSRFCFCSLFSICDSFYQIYC